MKALPRIALSMAVALAAVFCLSAVHLKLAPTVTAATAAVGQDQVPPDQGQDPAAINMAPQGPSYTTEAPPPPDQSGAQGPDDSNYAEQPTEQASQPPPPLPDYQQPPPPADGYIWTPGYWAWAPSGYYWVPGAWVEPPYMGALWTPGYWGFYTGRYSFFPGHWGSHIGFYGGINYGFGYIGLGYEGGYWNSGRFFYNRAYNHINTRVVHNVYEFHAPARGVDEHRGGYDQHNAPRGGYDPHASYHGGPGGVQVHPQASEAQAWHEPTAPRMSTQVQHAQSYQNNRGQYAARNNGQPRTPAISHPLPADRNVQPAMRAPGNNQNHGGGHDDHHH